MEERAKDQPGHTDALVEQAQAGDLPAYEELYERIAHRLLLYIHLRLGEPLRRRVEPSDLLQETYLEAHRSFATFRAEFPGSFLSWICTIADHRIRNAASHHSAQRRSLKREATDPAIGQAASTGATGPATACIRADEQERLLSALSTLGNLERRAVLLRFYQEMSLQEIGEAVGVSISTVRRVLGRAAHELGTFLKEPQG